MSKLDDKAGELFGRSSQSNNFVEAFEVREAAAVTANFRQEFVAAPLSKEEDLAIQNLLYKDSEANADEQEVEVDYKTLSDLTQQIRAIDRQSVLLHGERIQKARELLKKYRDGAFTGWLVTAYGNRQTPYRMLNFFELFQKLEGQDRPLFEKMPRNAAYSLASREGNLSEKIAIIRDHHSKTPEEISIVLDATFPLAKGDRRVGRKSDDDVIVKTLEDGIRKLMKRKNDLSDSTKEKLKALAKEIEGIFSICF